MNSLAEHMSAPYGGVRFHLHELKRRTRFLMQPNAAPLDRIEFEDTTEITRMLRIRGKNAVDAILEGHDKETIDSIVVAVIVDNDYEFLGWLPEQRMYSRRIWFDWARNDADTGRSEE